MLLALYHKSSLPNLGSQNISPIFVDFFFRVIRCLNQSCCSVGSLDNESRIQFSILILRPCLQMGMFCKFQSSIDLRLGAESFPAGSVVRKLPANAGDANLEDPLEGEWQPTPVVLPGECSRHRNLVGYSLWGRKESGMMATRRQQHRFFFIV